MPPLIQRWKRWRGTVFSETWPSVVRNMCLALCVSLLHTLCPGFINRTLSGFDILWGQLLSVTTFTLTFFLNQSYALWRKCYELSRRLQGRLNDLGMTMAAHAARTVKMAAVAGGGDGDGGAGSGAGGGADYVSRYTAESSQILQVMARYIRMFNLMTYASFTRSHRPILTPRGMRRLVERGLLTAREREVLVDSELPPHAAAQRCAHVDYSDLSRGTGGWTHRGRSWLRAAVHGKVPRHSSTVRCYR